MDVLIHAATIERDRVKKLYEDAGITVIDAATFQKQDASLLGVFNDLNTDAGASGGADQGNVDTIESTWCTVLGDFAFTPRENGVEVCESGTSYFRCGASCTWTVPSNVERVLFQSWGPGGLSGSNCCCGGSAFGPSGAYTAVEISVTPGDSYTICAGCAYCCYAYQTTSTAVSGDTTISGPGLDIATLGACPSICFWNSDSGQKYNSYCATGAAAQYPGGNGCGPNTCSSGGLGFCWDNNADDVDMPFAYTSRTWNINNIGGTDPVFYGVPGMWPQMRIVNAGMNSSSYSQSAPAVGFPGSSCVFNNYGQSCFGCNYRACQGHRQFPSVGGSAGSVAGGCNACGGDSGRMGMVCISWNTV